MQVRATTRAAMVGGAVALGVGVSAAIAAAALTAYFARAIVTPPRRRPQDVTILAYDAKAQKVTLSANADTRLPGRYSLWFSGETGHARVGDVIAADADTVVRRVTAVDFGDLAVARHGRMAGWYYLGPWELDIPYESCSIQTPLGEAPAWLFPAASTRWVIQIHGRAVRRLETLRAVPVFHEAEYNALVISYRNDGEGPESEDSRYGLGATEWEDAAAAVAFAAAHGATEIVLMGWSMGGAIAVQTLFGCKHSALITGLVLDSPAVDWSDVIEFQGVGYRLPAAVRAGARRTLARPWGRALTGLAAPIDFDQLNVVMRAAEITVPVLIQHSDDDGYVPSTGSHALAAARPDIVTATWWSQARHTKLWNLDPERWEGAIREWLAGLDAGRR